MEYAQKTIICRNCKSPRLHEVTPNFIEEKYGGETILYTLLQCKSCKTVVLEEVKYYHTDEAESKIFQTPLYYPEPSVNSILPIENKLDAIPDKIYQIYLLCTQSYNAKLKKACLLYIYSIIEAISLHFGQSNIQISISTRLKKIHFHGLKENDVENMLRIADSASRFLQKNEDDININVLQSMVDKTKDLLYLEFIHTKLADLARQEMPDFLHDDIEEKEDYENPDTSNEPPLHI